ncbi:MAG: DNA-binding transcriptional LysR family regulator [Polyangiales bacterium]|jgi:DNA-binding transcriptional LysR family regulator
MDWDLVRSFHAVMEAGTLSGAARQLGISQPTVGRHVAELEEQLGAVLFERAGRLRPTDSAHSLMAHAEAMHAAATQLRLRAAGEAQSLAGSVRVTASQVVAIYRLPPILTRISKEQPNIELELVVSNDTQNLLRRDADIALRMVEPTQKEIIAQRIGDIPMGLFAHRSYLGGCRVPQSFEDLQGHTFIGYDRSELLIRGIRAFGMASARSDFRIRTDDQVAQVELMLAGAGIAATQCAIASAHPDVVQLLPDLSIPPLSLWLATHREVHTSARVRAIYDLLAREMRAALAP